MFKKKKKSEPLIISFNSCTSFISNCPFIGGEMYHFSWYFTHTLLDLAKNFPVKLIHHTLIFSVTYPFWHLLIKKRFAASEWKYWWKYTFINTEQLQSSRKSPWVSPGRSGFKIRLCRSRTRNLNLYLMQESKARSAMNEQASPSLPVETLVPRHFGMQKKPGISETFIILL